MGWDRWPKAYHLRCTRRDVAMPRLYVEQIVRTRCRERFQGGKTMSSFSRFTRRQFVAAAGAFAGSAFLPDTLRGTVLQDPVLNNQAPGRERVQWQAFPFPMKQVRLLPGPCQETQEANRRYLHS